MRIERYPRKTEIERRIGMPIREYVRRAAAQGLSQNDMARELGVQAVTIGRWIEREGLKRITAYVEV